MDVGEVEGALEVELPAPATLVWRKSSTDLMPEARCLRNWSSALKLWCTMLSSDPRIDLKEEAELAGVAVVAEDVAGEVIGGEIGMEGETILEAALFGDVLLGKPQVRP